MKNNGKNKITEEEKKLATSIMEHAKGKKFKRDGASLVGLRWIFSYKKRLFRRLDGCEITDCRIELSDLTKMDFKDSNFRETVFKACVLSGVNFGDAQMERCTFIDCSMVDINFEGANLKGSHFHNCDMRWGRVSGADFDGATFEKTSLDKTLNSTAKGLKVGKVN